ncbi:DNA alkylation repair protein [Paenibacillus athensensis]|nr:DNA alkylation repair protein [Paenibacillus athensensis]MCD1261456.1 DNA alkylation repair protein [Paenibacillus athensensis]
MTLLYTQKLEACLRDRGNRQIKPAMEAYQRNQFPFLGIRSPELAVLLRAFWQEEGLPAADELLIVVAELWALPEREYHYAAMQLLEKRRKLLTPQSLALLERLIVDKAWWDTVDLLASQTVGGLLLRHPELIDDAVARWMASGHMWLQRTALLFQLKYKQRTDTELLFDCIRRLAGSREFFIRKAIGWALREYAKTDAAAVRAFVASVELSPLSVREALKRVASAEPTNELDNIG